MAKLTKEKAVQKQKPENRPKANDGAKAPKYCPVSAAPTPKKKRYFNRRLFIPNFGMVDAGDELTKEALEAWQGKTTIPIAGYVGEKSDVKQEIPMTDKEKVAAYEALNKE